MQTVYLGKSNRIILNTEKVVDVVKLSMVTATGAYIKNSANNDIDDIPCTKDANSGKYYYDLTPHNTTSPGDVYLYWGATYNGLSVDLESKYSPEDGVIQKVVSSDRMLVSPSWVMDNYLRGISEEDIAATYPGKSYRNAIRDQILIATQELERMTMVHFTPKTITGERHDWEMDQLWEKFWTVALYEYPIISITSVKCKINEMEVIDIPMEWVQIGNKMEGLVKVNPYAGGTPGIAYKFMTKGMLGLALITSDSHIVPDFFEYTYVAGIDFDNEPVYLQNDIKSAIGRRVALNMLPNLDVHRGLSSESRSLDGASTSRSYTSSATFGEHSAALAQYEKAERLWIHNFKRKYLKTLHAL